MLDVPASGKLNPPFIFPTRAAEMRKFTPLELLLGSCPLRTPRRSSVPSQRPNRAPKGGGPQAQGRSKHEEKKASEQNALQMLVERFDWLDSLEPRGTTGIVTKSQKREATSTILLSHR